MTKQEVKTERKVLHNYRAMCKSTGRIEDMQQVVYLTKVGNKYESKTRHEIKKQL